ncbi:inositol polyphosphate 5-phosphatase OCRL [Uranotaenia lowii]|uniref:inositol polyphosphate 5-phosphatase OCRL n=1 Tax=Uranotaenia lowii TaxID=190385 RepID=UPI00247A28C8|nr:inositol polyphosphate 5-phosphatase OCRL [Uranotaenia lowii]
MNTGHYDTTIITTVTQKFRDGESILAIFEGYQIVGNRHQNRLLVIVSSNYTSALFTFSIARYPPESISDLTIVSVHPIDEAFWVNPESAAVSSISSHQFTIFSHNEPTVYYYQASPDTIASRDNFIAKLKQLIAGYKSASSQAAAASGSLDFKWLEYYKRADMLAIDRNIADGSQAPKTRDSKFKEELERRRHEYVVYEPYKIYTATWNVNGQTAEDIELPEWLSTTEDPPDIYAVAFQEIEWTPEKIIMNETKIDRTWVNKVMSGLHSGAVYEELASVRLVGMMLTVAVKKSLRDQISDCLTAAVGTGTLKWGNKGGVGVSFQLNESLLCFVNAHLAAHTQEVDRRNEDHDEIIRRMSFEKTFRGRSIDEHHHIFWIGDLNYRLNGEISQEFVNEKDRDYNQLYPYDQLYLEKLRKRIFREYKEGKILFGPTYKYNPGTDDWDSSEKNRCPAWCDRILWKGPRIDLLKYDSVMQLRKSDHKPVFAVFNVNIETKDEEKFKKVHEEVLKTVDKYENDNQPQITVEQTDLDFGLIRFNEKYSRELLVANNCHLPVRFKFAAKDERHSNVCEEFIQISHKSGELITGNSLSIRIDIFVDAKAASCMLKKLKDAKAGVKIPLDILVLHVENGRDIFITIFGEYKSSCFGVSLETLMKLNKPIYEYEINELIALEKEEKLLDLTDDEELKIPREIWRLVDYLYNNGMESSQLFTLNRTHSKHENILEIRDWLDSWSSEAFPGVPKTAAEALLLLLESLPEPVVTISVHDCYVYADNYEKCRELIRTKLKPVHRLVFLYICMFLIELRRRNPSIRLEQLAAVFGKALIRPTQPPVARTPAGNEVYAYTDGERDQRRKFMMTFLMSKVQEFAKAEMNASGK